MVVCPCCVCTLVQDLTRVQNSFRIGFPKTYAGELSMHPLFFNPHRYMMKAINPIFIERRDNHLCLYPGNPWNSINLRKKACRDLLLKLSNEKPYIYIWLAGLGKKVFSIERIRLRSDADQVVSNHSLTIADFFEQYEEFSKKAEFYFRFDASLFGTYAIGQVHPQNFEQLFFRHLEAQCERALRQNKPIAVPEDLAGIEIQYSHLKRIIETLNERSIQRLRDEYRQLRSLDCLKDEISCETVFNPTEEVRMP